MAIERIFTYPQVAPKSQPANAILQPPQCGPLCRLSSLQTPATATYLPAVPGTCFCHTVRPLATVGDRWPAVAHPRLRRWLGCHQQPAAELQGDVAPGPPGRPFAAAGSRASASRRRRIALALCAAASTTSTRRPRPHIVQGGCRAAVRSSASHSASPVNRQANHAASPRNTSDSNRVWPWPSVASVGPPIAPAIRSRIACRSAWARTSSQSSPPTKAASSGTPSVTGT
mmetsp:Transcript_3914/g.9818  ORF Transcript_3914/g.9818 Transcript_3914/m.9818 type:complete len:229 (-) Transcript_3914:1069-1755(-)